MTRVLVPPGHLVAPRQLASMSLSTAQYHTHVACTSTYPYSSYVSGPTAVVGPALLLLPPGRQSRVLLRMAVCPVVARALQMLPDVCSRSCHAVMLVGRTCRRLTFCFCRCRPCTCDRMRESLSEAQDRLSD